MRSVTTQLLEQGARQIFPSVLTTLAALALYYLVRRFTRSMARDQQITPIMALRFRLVARWTLVSGTTLVVLQQLGVFQQAWAVLSALAALLAVAFVASWSVLSNATAAFLVLIYRPFRVGDEIELLEFDGKSVVSGRVVDLNLLFTTVLEASDALVRVPNNVFVQKYARVRRHGHAPDPTRDSKEPFFTISPGTRYAHRSTSPAASDQPV